jgi:NADH-quinone oxidoreductase subunit E
MPKVKKVVLAGLLLAILIVFERFMSVETQILRLSFAYVPVILIGTLLGPVWGALIGVAGDLLGMLLMPKASFFAGFTLNALLTGLVYGSFLHKAPSNKSYLVRLVISILIVHIFIHLGLTTLWLTIMYKRAFMVLLAGRLVANIIEIPIEIASMYAIKIFLDKPVKKYLLEDSSESDFDTEDKTKFDPGIVDAVIKVWGAKPGSIIPILQGIQEKYNYLPPETFSCVAEKLGVSEARIYGVATFYENFSLQPKGKFIIKVCDGTACHVRKSLPNLEKFRKELGLSEKKITTDDLSFTVQTVACLGACSLAPAFMVQGGIPDKVYANVTPDQIPGILEELRAKL